MRVSVSWARQLGQRSAPGPAVTRERRQHLGQRKGFTGTCGASPHRDDDAMPRHLAVLGARVGSDVRGSALADAAAPLSEAFFAPSTGGPGGGS